MRSKIKMLSIVATLFALVAMVGCLVNDTGKKPNVGDQVNIIIGRDNLYKKYSTEYVLDQTLGDHLDAIIQETSMHNKFGGSQFIGGDRYIEELDTLIPQYGEYIFILANDDDPLYTGGMGLQAEYDGQVFYDLNAGLDQVQIRAGVSYLFTILKWQ